MGSAPIIDFEKIDSNNCHLSVGSSSVIHSRHVFIFCHVTQFFLFLQYCKKYYDTAFTIRTYTVLYETEKKYGTKENVFGARFF